MRWECAAYSEGQIQLVLDRAMDDFHNYAWCTDPLVLALEETEDILWRRIPNLFRTVPLLRKQRSFQSADQARDQMRLFFEAISQHQSTEVLQETMSFNLLTARDNDARRLMVEVGDLLCGSKKTERKAAQKKRAKKRNDDIVAEQLQLELEQQEEQ